MFWPVDLCPPRTYVCTYIYLRRCHQDADPGVVGGGGWAEGGEGGAFKKAFKECLTDGMFWV